MNIDCINGQEPRQKLSPALQALSGFYHAFNRRDAAASAANWANTEDVIMSNPIGGMRRGWRQIKSGYEKIMHGPARVYVEFHDFILQQSDGFFYVAGRERGRFVRGDEEIALHIRTSRVYQLIDHQWRQVHHHGSIDDPALLRIYQEAIHRL